MSLRWNRSGGSCVVAVIFLLIVGSSAHGATLTVTPGQTTYSVGDTIELHVVGDAEGASGIAAFARLLFGGSAGVTPLFVDPPICAPFPCITGWTAGPLSVGPDWAVVINHLAGITPVVPDNLFAAIVFLSADASGVMTVDWDVAPGPNQLHFFGLTTAPGTLVTIVPEPGTALLLGLGLALLAARRARAGRRPSSRGSRSRRSLPRRGW